MGEKTVYVYPSREGSRSDGWTARHSDSSQVFATQADAIEYASKLAREKGQMQVLVFEGGQFHTEKSYGLRKLQTPPRKTKIGLKRIRKAVGQTTLRRLYLQDEKGASRAEA